MRPLETKTSPSEGVTFRALTWAQSDVGCACVIKWIYSRCIGCLRLWTFEAACLCILPWCNPLANSALHWMTSASPRNELHSIGFASQSNQRPAIPSQASFQAPFQAHSCCLACWACCLDHQIGVQDTNDSLENKLSQKVLNLQSRYFGKHVPAKIWMSY